MASYHFSIKSGKRGKAAKHAAYIARVGKLGKDADATDLVVTDHGNLPSWTQGNPDTFWQAADQNERVNGAAYRELEIALPAELSEQQRLHLVKDIITLEIGDKPFQYAIHRPVAALGKVDQPHVHIMFSDRRPDGIERGPQQHFKRFNARNPELGGCKKDSGGKSPSALKSEVLTRREHCANLQNAYLEQHGHAARVDHRSHQERGIERKAERHLGPIGIKKMSAEDKRRFRGQRQGSQRPAA